MVFLLGKEHNLKNLHSMSAQWAMQYVFMYIYVYSAVHRLDRLTSGLLMFAKTVSKAQQLEVEIRERKVTKVYVCRVKGEFLRCVSVYDIVFLLVCVCVCARVYIHVLF